MEVENPFTSSLRSLSPQTDVRRGVWPEMSGRGEDDAPVSIDRGQVCLGPSDETKNWCPASNI